jgi:hypothetical protein
MSAVSGGATFSDDSSLASGLLAWSELEESDFYRWFGMHEVGRSAMPDTGWTAVQVKPGGHQQAIALVVYVDGRQRVQQAMLSMDRAWVDGGPTAKLADDLAQSFLLTFARGSAEAPKLARAIFEQVRGSQPIVRRADAVASPETLTPVVSVALAAYQRGGRAIIAEPGLHIALDHPRGPDSVRLAIEVAATRSARSSVASAEPAGPVRAPWWRFW